MKRATSSILALLLFFTMSFSTVPVFAGSETDTTSGTTYYVDANNGNDANSGTSPEQAWKSLTKVTATTFQPGDEILLKSGCAGTGSCGPYAHSG